MNNPENTNKLFSVLSAAQPGAHAPAQGLNKEYDEKIVNAQLQFIRDSTQWSAQQIEQWQIKQLRNILCIAGMRTPYYQKLFARLGFNPQQFSHLSQLQQLPLLNKNIIKSNYDDFIPLDLNTKELSYMTTGGSTGSPLKILMDRCFRSKNHANTWFSMEVAGFVPGQSPSVRLHGNVIDNAAIESGEFWIQERNRLTMSVYHISRENCAAYMQAIRQHQPAYIHAYASAISLLVHYANDLNLSFPDSIKCVFCDSETLYPWQRSLLEDSIAPVFNTYGHTEGATCAITFPDSKLLYVLPQSGYLEVLDAQQQLVSVPHEGGEVVVTGFNNEVFPLIRYQTGDIATTAEAEQCNPCCFPALESVQGRIQDYVITRDMERIPIAPALFDYNFDWTGIDRFQVLQEQPGELEFKLVLLPEFETKQNELLQNVSKAFGKILGNDFVIRAVRVQDIPLTPRGKYRYFEQKVVL